ncbi:acetyl-CoA synthase subunit delta, partial [Archaeoglobales archaeon]
MDLESFLKFIEGHDVEKLENVVIEGGLEIEINEKNENIAILPLPVLQELQNFLYHANMAMSFIN